MRPGTPQFVGSRLKEAREARALTAISLADLLKVSRQAVSQYETGAQTPSPEVMEKIVHVLGFSMHFFLRPILPEPGATIFYRSLSSATKVQRARAERRYGWLREIVSYIHTLVEFPRASFPELSAPEDPTVITGDEVEAAAASVRRFWGLGDGPISDLTLLLETNGAVVARHELGADTLDAFSQWDELNSGPYIVLGTDKRSAVRSRFDAAHELGHMTLHRRVPVSALRTPATFKLIEMQANRFANAFLLPQRSFAVDFGIGSLDRLRALKAKWRVSIAAMIVRARQLHLTDEDQQRRLFINLSRRGWRLREPMDDTMPCEEPRLLRRSVDLLLRNRLLVPPQMEALYGLSIRDVEAVLGLPEGYLNTVEEPLRLRQQPATPASGEWPRNATTGNWIFPSGKRRE